MVQQKSKMEMEELKKRQQFEKKEEEKLRRPSEERWRSKYRRSRQRQEMRRDTFQKELDKLTMSLKEQSKKEEDTIRQIRRERKESQRERDIQMENMRAEKRRTLALQQELKIIRMKGEQQKETEENLKGQLEENLQMRKGNAQEMGLLGLNAALETVGAPCCIQ
ncbi:hypothetical protein JOQ06_013555 [Pogonophryne albipinna]|uniref:Uncharacterized protein n=1 Tax=Pogonophryne albipinna TaxID=1090488 RepID=A0AAD6BLK9_9TELE|nr:hypothetical protein JOQ06_013555 [Pogonophryne albipinna]